MDYIKLKQTLIAAFDHFLSCHDMDELEDMMQSLESGKRLVIGFPEPIHREDYKDDIALIAPDVKKNISHIRRRKPKSAKALSLKQKHIGDVPVFMDMRGLSKAKQEKISNILKTKPHNIILKNVLVKGPHIIAMAKIYSFLDTHKDQNQSSLWMGIDSEPIRPVKQASVKEKNIMLLQHKKQFDPP